MTHFYTQKKKKGKKNTERGPRIIHNLKAGMQNRKKDACMYLTNVLTVSQTLTHLAKK